MDRVGKASLIQFMKNATMKNLLIKIMKNLLIKLQFIFKHISD